MSASVAARQGGAGPAPGIPVSTRLGFLVLAAGVVIDVAYHLTGVGMSSRMGVVGHAVTLAGMVLALFGVIATAVQLRRHGRQERR